MFHLCADSLIEVGLKETTKTTFGLGFLITLILMKGKFWGTEETSGI
jgi:hypothetical protein